MNHVRGSSIWDSWIILASWATDAAPVIFWSMEDQVAQPWWEQHLEVGPLFLLGGNRGGFTGKLSANEWSWIKHTHLLSRISLGMWVTRVILIVLLYLMTKGSIWSLSCRVEENCLTRLEVIPSISRGRNYEPQQGITSTRTSCWSPLWHAKFDV